MCRGRKRRRCWTGHVLGLGAGPLGVGGQAFVGRCLVVGRGEEAAWQVGGWWRDNGSMAVFWVILLAL